MRQIMFCIVALFLLTEAACKLRSQSNLSQTNPEEDGRAPRSLEDDGIDGMLNRPIGVCRFLGWNSNSAIRVSLFMRIIPLLETSDIEALKTIDADAYLNYRQDLFNKLLGQIKSEGPNELSNYASETGQPQYPLAVHPEVKPKISDSYAWQVSNDLIKTVETFRNEGLTDASQLLARLKTIPSYLKIVRNGTDLLGKCGQLVNSGVKCEAVEFAGHAGGNSLSLSKIFGIYVSDDVTIVYPDREMSEDRKNPNAEVANSELFNKPIANQTIDESWVNRQRLDQLVASTTFGKITQCINKISAKTAPVVYTTCGGVRREDTMVFYPNKQPAHVLMSMITNRDTASAVGPCRSNGIFGSTCDFGWTLCSLDSQGAE